MLCQPGGEVGEGERDENKPLISLLLLDLASFTEYQD